MTRSSHHVARAKISAFIVGAAMLAVSGNLAWTQATRPEAATWMHAEGSLEVRFTTPQDLEPGADRRWTFPRTRVGRLAIGDSLTFALPGGRSVELTLRDRSYASDSSIGFVFANPERGCSAEVVLADGAVRGTLRVLNGGATEHWALSTDPLTGEDMFREVPLAGECAGTLTAPNESSDGGVAGDCNDGSGRIDLLVAYTQSFLANFSSLDELKLRVAADVAEANAGLTNSLVSTRFFIVGWYEIPGSGLGTLGADLNALTSASDGIWDGVHDARNDLRADLVTMYTDSETGGLAWLGYGNEAFGFSVLGSNGGFLLAHELGHNMGACHAVEDVSCTGFFPFSRAHRLVAFGSTYRTIMAYSPGQQIPHYSNPIVKYLEQPTGVPGETSGLSANNARTLATSAITVARYRCGQTTLPDCDSDGISDDLAISKGIVPDCNLTGIPDSCDIALGLSIDSDSNGIPDECPLEEEAELTPSGLRPLDVFGTAVDIGWRANSSRLIGTVGAPGYDLPGHFNAGAVYAYSSDSNGVFTAPPQLLTAGSSSFPALPEPQSNAAFGRDVATFLRPRSAIGSTQYPPRDFVLAGAFRWTESSSVGLFPSKGAVYLFARDGLSSGPLRQLWRYTPPATGGFQAREESLFGYSAAISRNRREPVEQIVVGAPGHTNGRGRVYFLRNYFVFDPALGYARERGGLLYIRDLPTPTDGDMFGAAVALDANVPVGGSSRVVAVIGAPGRNDGKGAAYVYDRSASGVASTQSIGTFPPFGYSLVPTGTYALAEGDRFGTSVAISGRLVVVSAPGARGGRGVVHFFERISQGSNPSVFSYVYRGYFKAPDGQPDDALGTSLSIAPTLQAGLSGYRVVIGAPNADVSTSTGLRANAGKVYVVQKRLGDQEANLISVRTDPLPSTGDSFGSSSASMPGRALIGVPFNDSAGLNAGKAKLLLTP